MIGLSIRILAVLCLLSLASRGRADVAVLPNVDTESAEVSGAERVVEAVSMTARPTPVPRPSAARPSLSAEQRTEWAARLRDLYARPAA